ncbi:ATP-binding protein [Shewanella waksmanii]|uniref:ATP-binding protein n=1 Tax=Shewanella waksmanii TaxID=213783 RepID=UPI0037364A0E
MALRSFPLQLSLNSIGTKVIVAMLSISLLVIVLSTSNYLMNQRVSTDTSKVSLYEIPKAIATINMLDEIGDMNANILEYSLGEVDEKQEFDKNQAEFYLYLTQLKNALKNNDKRVAEIEQLFQDYQTAARAEVFNRYNPESEEWAKQRVKGLTEVTGRKLEQLLDSLKQSEINDVGSQADLREVINDDLPGVRYYLELVDEAGDMVANLTEYISGVYQAKQSFVENAQNFEEYLTKLKPLERRPNEMEELNDVEALYKVLRDGGFEVFQRYNATNKITAIQAIDELEHKTFARLEQLLDDMSKEAESSASISLNGLHDITESNQYVLFTSLILVLILSGGIILFTYQVIIRPITKLSGTMKQLADGDTDVEIVYLGKNDEVGNMAKAMEVFKRNIIARNQAERELVEAKENAEAASKAKASFLATMSHEIRTPMNGVIGMIDLMLTTQMNHEQRQMTSTIRNSAFSLLNIINDILDFSKIEAGKLTLEHISFSMEELLEGVVDTITPTADKQQVSLQLYIDPQIPSHLIGDPIRIRQVLFNLIGNAVKFSAGDHQQGAVKVLLTMADMGSKKVTFNIDIIDNGIGISEQAVELLFKPFTQAESSTTRRYGGTGLGLAICYNLINLMGGSIKVSSEVGKGSTFTLDMSLPYVAQNRINLSEYQHTCNFLDIQSKWHQQVVQEYLQDSQIPLHNLTAAKLQTLPAEQHDVITIITDNLPSTIAQYADYMQPPYHLPLRFLVLDYASRGAGMMDERTFAIAASPLKRSTLLFGYRVTLGKDSPLDIAEVEAQEVIAADASVEDAEAAGRLILVAEDNQTNQEVIKRQLLKLGYTCLIANDGVEAEQLYPQHQFAAVLTDCHMPNKDGYELAASLKASQKQQGNRIPIIAITANALLGEAEKCLAAGMDDYLAKPIEMVKLKKVLQQWLQPSHVAPAKSLPEMEPMAFSPPAQVIASKAIDTPIQLAGQPAVAATNQHTEMFDDSVISDVFADDVADYAASLADFLELTMPQLRAMAKDNQFDISTIGQIAHKLKSSAKTMGIVQLAEHCEIIEQAAKHQDIIAISQSLSAISTQLDEVEAAVNQRIAQYR